MKSNLEKSMLLNSEEKYQEMARLIILKMAARWLEKQEWVNSAYGGQNPVQDLIFQTHLTANCIWEDFFSDKENRLDYDKDQLKKTILEIGSLSPELKEFFNEKSKTISLELLTCSIKS